MNETERATFRKLNCGKKEQTKGFQIIKFNAPQPKPFQEIR